VISKRNPLKILKKKRYVHNYAETPCNFNWGGEWLSVDAFLVHLLLYRYVAHTEGAWHTEGLQPFPVAADLEFREVFLNRHTHWAKRLCVFWNNRRTPQGLSIRGEGEGESFPPNTPTPPFKPVV
jgi:hypothetical protein